MTYILTVLDATTSKWDNSEGEGDFVGAYDLNIKSASFKELTADNIINAISSVIPLDDGITAFNLYAEDESGIGSFNQLESLDGQPNMNADYIVDYTYKIERIETINLSKLDFYNKY